MIPITLTLEPKHLVGAKARYDPVASATSNMFMELPGVRKCLTCQSVIILYGEDEEFRFTPPADLQWQERQLYTDSTFTDYSFTEHYPQWVHPEWKVPISNEEIPTLREMFRDLWKKIMP